MALTLDEETEAALGDASTRDMVDLAAIMGFHSMMTQGQFPIFNAILLACTYPQDLNYSFPLTANFQLTTHCIPELGFGVG